MFDLNLQSDSIDDSHRQEWLASGINLRLIALNLRTYHSGQREQIFDLLFDWEKIPRCNGGHVARSFLRRYNYLDQGGWGVIGYDLTTLSESSWGCFKPNSPRIDPKKGKPIKYEHPRNCATQIFVLRLDFLSACEITLSHSDCEEFANLFFDRLLKILHLYSDRFSAFGRAFLSVVENREDTRSW